jgi:opacity protein-like surface antigen
MSLIKNLLPLSLGLILTSLCHPAFAYYTYPDYLPNEMSTHVEISGAFGPNWTHSDSTHVIVSQYETDSVLESGVSNSSLWKIGVGYHLFEDRLRRNQFLTDLLLSLNVYQSSQSVKGYVEQYQLPQFNNYSFRAPVQSTRLLFEVRPGLLTVYRFTPYPIVGIGVSWNNTSYNEAANPGIDPATSYELGAKTNIGFTYNLGAGLRIDLVPHLSGSIEYLYSYLGSALPSGSAVPPTGLLTVPSFILHSQAVLFGLNYKLG